MREEIFYFLFSIFYFSSFAVRVWGQDLREAKTWRQLSWVSVNVSERARVQWEMEGLPACASLGRQTVISGHTYCQSLNNSGPNGCNHNSCLQTAMATPNRAPPPTALAALYATICALYMHYSWHSLHECASTAAISCGTHCHRPGVNCHKSTRRRSQAQSTCKWSDLWWVQTPFACQRLVT